MLPLVTRLLGPPTRSTPSTMLVGPVRVVLGLVLVGLAMVVSGCAVLAPDSAGGHTEQALAAIRAGQAAGVPVLRPVVVATLPHDTDAWTEGLEIDGGLLYESTGLAGHSRLRELDPATGRVLRSVALPDDLYGEGLTVLGERIWQLTYTDHVALSWDRRTLRPGPRLPYPGEGWGLCHIPGRPAPGTLVASDGSNTLRLLSGTDLHSLGTVAVRLAGRALPALNELECVPGAVWANVYETDYLVRIDLPGGTVSEIVDASSLVPPAARADPGTVLNGIAAIPGTDEFLLTGKYWPYLYRVRMR